MEKVFSEEDRLENERQKALAHSVDKQELANTDESDLEVVKIEDESSVLKELEEKE